MIESFGPYEIVRLLGRGGMGEVYLARDTRLDREVALKLLPAELADDEERRARFLREARAAATLNHPHVTTIHEVGETDGRDYIVQEYLEGRPLDDLIAERTLSTAELAQVAVPLADALAYAHERGVIHRDIKPANVVLTERGHAKLLDFGLAKVMRPDDGLDAADRDATTLTLSGAVFGTPSAMSPEQALGKAVDARSDIFAFGALLYELASGERAFAGTTIRETLDRVVHAEPEPLETLRRDLPADFVAVVDKALRKDPDERYQSMAEMAADLRHFQRATDSGIVPTTARAGRSGWSRRLLVVALVVIAALTWKLMQADDDPRTLRLTNPRQLTAMVGAEDGAVWSPEGGLIAYMGAEPGRERDIWLTQEGAGTPVNRTTELDGDAVFPSFSPDGRTIAFWLVEGLDNAGLLVGARGLYTMPALGGAPRLVVREAFSYGPPQWSADGEQLAYFHRVGDVATDSFAQYVIRIITTSGELVREVSLPALPTVFRADLSWSPDGRFFAFCDAADPRTADVNRLWILRESDGECVALTDARSRSDSPRWSADGRFLDYVSNQGGTKDLWRQEVDDDGRPVGDPVVLTAGVGMTRIDFSSDGTRLVYGRGGMVGNVWRLPLHDDRPATWEEARQVTFDEAYVEYADLSPDGETLALSSNRAGNPDLWLMPAEGGAMRQLTDDPAPDWYPRWSPDGEQILFYAARSGNRDLWVMPREGGAPRQLTTHPMTDWFGDWSPDGRRVLWVSRRGGSPWFYTSPLDPFVPTPLPDVDAGAITTAVGAWLDDTSFLGRFVESCAVMHVDGHILRRYPEPDPKSNNLRVVPGGREVLYDDGAQIMALDLDSGELRATTALSGRPGLMGAVMATDGEQVWFTWLQERIDLWTMDVEVAGR